MQLYNSRFNVNCSNGNTVSQYLYACLCLKSLAGYYYCCYDGGTVPISLAFKKTKSDKFSFKWRGIFDGNDHVDENDTIIIKLWHERGKEWRTSLCIPIAAAEIQMQSFYYSYFGSFHFSYCSVLLTQSVPGYTKKERIWPGGTWYYFRNVFYAKKSLLFDVLCTTRGFLSLLFNEIIAAGALHMFVNSTKHIRYSWLLAHWPRCNWQAKM